MANATDRTAGIIGDFGIKAPVTVCATTNIVLSGEQTIDGVLTSNSDVLLTGQTDSTQNGIYNSDSGTWTRRADFDGARDARTGTLVFVVSGTANQGFWGCTSPNTVTPDGSMAITFARTSSTLAVISAYWQAILTTTTPDAAITALRAFEPDTLANISMVPTVGGSALTMNLKTRAGAIPSASDPIMVSQRDVTQATGDFNLRLVTAALALTIPSSATLGHSNNVAGNIFWYLLDNGGTEELACSTTFFGMAGIVTTTTISAAATSSSVMYSTTGRANLPYRCIGFTIDTQVTAGTWAAVPTTVQLVPFIPTSAFSASSLIAATLPLVPMVNGTLVATVGSSALTVALKTAAGADPSVSDPVFMMFRDSTIGTGDYIVLTITSALSLVVSSGSTLGTSSATAARLYICGFNDAGTPRLGIYNPLSGVNLIGLQDDLLYSSTAEGGIGGADSAQTIYTGAAVTSKALRVLGYIEATEGTAGTWATTPSKIQLMGPGVKRTGDVLQTFMPQTGASTTGTNVTNRDDTPAVQTESNIFMTQAVTPLSAINLLDIQTLINVANSAVSIMIAGLYQDATANPLKTTAGTSSAAGIGIGLMVRHRMVAGTTSSTTIKAGAAAISAGTTTFNGEGGSRTYGGFTDSFLLIEEIMV